MSNTNAAASRLFAAHPFLDVGAIGWAATAMNGALITLSFLLAGFALVWVDDRLAARRSQA